MKLFKKPNPWFTIYMLGSLALMPILFLHLITFGFVNGVGVWEAWLDYTFNRSNNLGKKENS